MLVKLARGRPNDHTRQTTKDEVAEPTNASRTRIDDPSDKSHCKQCDKVRRRLALMHERTRPPAQSEHQEGGNKRGPVVIGLPAGKYLSLTSSQILHTEHNITLGLATLKSVLQHQRIATSTCRVASPHAAAALSPIELPPGCAWTSSCSHSDRLHKRRPQDIHACVGAVCGPQSGSAPHTTRSQVWQRAIVHVPAYGIVRAHAQNGAWCAHVWQRKPDHVPC